MKLVDLIPRVEKALDGRAPKRLGEAGLMSAAVLIPFFPRDEEAFLLFTKRTEEVQTHKGQISFPGGLRDPQDSTLLATALRECEEEIGLEAGSVKILGQLDEEATYSAPIVITPFVGVISYPRSFRLNPREVQRLLEVPLSFFLHGPPARVKQISHKGQQQCVYYYDYGEDVIWGATARIIRNFLHVVFGTSGPVLSPESSSLP